MAQEGKQETRSESLREQRHESRTGTTFRKFLSELCASGGYDEEFAARATGAVLCLLEQRMQRGGGRNLEAQLPIDVREILSVCERPAAGGPLKKFNREEFVAGVASSLGIESAEAESVIRAVFATVRGRISEGEAVKVAAQLPRDLGIYWAPVA